MDDPATPPIPVAKADKEKPNDSLGTPYTALVITFLLACLYVGATVASTTHRLLLLEGFLKLPNLDVSIPLKGFYVVAPAVIICLHTYLLLQYYRALRTSPLDEDSEPWVSRLIRIGLVLINILLPVLVLCLVQYYFIPYHSVWITRWHQALIVIDLIAIWYFFLRRADLKLWPLNRRVLIIAGAFAGVLYYSFFLATVPVTSSDYHRKEFFCKPSWLQRNLDLSGQLLISEAPSQEVMAAFADRNPDASSQAYVYLRFAVGASLQGRDLRCANLEQAKLFNADLRGADLSGAWLVGADLRGANLNPQNMSSEMLQQPRGSRKREDIADILSTDDFKPARLDRAALAGAQFEKAKMILVSMHHADLRGANLDGLELTGANLSEANLSGAWLAGSELSHVKLDGAVMQGARLEGATLNHASLVGANLTEVEAPAASFANADLEGAELAGANLRAASFLDARFIGSDLRRAHLQSVRDFRVERSDLRGAHLGAGCGVRFKTLSDLRLIDFLPPSPEDWRRWRMDVEERLKGRLQGEIDTVLEELIRAEQQLPAEFSAEAQAACIGTPLVAPAANGNNQILYFEEQRTGVMENWPPLASQKRGAWNESVFYRDLAADLLGRVCDSPGLARMLTWRAAGEYVPGDEAFDIEVARQILPKLQDPQSCAALQAFLAQTKNDHKVDLARQIAWRLRRHEKAMQVQRERW